MAKLIKYWSELDGLENDNYKIEVDTYIGCGWIRSKREDRDIYLTTHTFYGNNYKNSTQLLQEHGFDVELANWDEVFKF